MEAHPLCKSLPERMKDTSQQMPEYKKLGITTARGVEWFEFSPQKLKEYLLELAMDVIKTEQADNDDMDPGSFLSMCLLDTDASENSQILGDLQPYGSSLLAALNESIEDEARTGKLRRVIYRFKMDFTNSPLVKEIEESFDKDLAERGIENRPEYNMDNKVC
jgi:hypothetical protein